MAGDRECDGIFYDGQSRYYIDGSVQRAGRLLCLAYDEQMGTYYELCWRNAFPAKEDKVSGVLRPL